MKKKFNWFVCLISYYQNGKKFDNLIPSNSNLNSINVQSSQTNNNISENLKKLQQQKSSAVNRTIIVALQLPSKTLALMNAGDDENITSAVQKALKIQEENTRKKNSLSFLSTSSSLLLKRQQQQQQISTTNIININQQNISTPSLTLLLSTLNRYVITCAVGPIDNAIEAKILVDHWEKSKRGLISRAKYGYQLANHFNLKFGIDLEHYSNVEKQQQLSSKKKKKRKTSSSSSSSPLISLKIDNSNSKSNINVKKSLKSNIIKKKKFLKKK